MDLGKAGPEGPPGLSCSNLLLSAASPSFSRWIFFPVSPTCISMSFIIATLRLCVHLQGCAGLTCPEQEICHNRGPQVLWEKPRSSLQGPGRLPGEESGYPLHWGSAGRAYQHMSSQCPLLCAPLQALKVNMKTLQEFCSLVGEKISRHQTFNVHLTPVGVDVQLKHGTMHIKIQLLCSRKGQPGHLWIHTRSIKPVVCKHYVSPWSEWAPKFMG